MRPISKLENYAFAPIQTQRSAHHCILTTRLLIFRWQSNGGMLRTQDSRLNAFSLNTRVCSLLSLLFLSLLFIYYFLTAQEQAALAASEPVSRHELYLVVNYNFCLFPFHSTIQISTLKETTTMRQVRVEEGEMADVVRRGRWWWWSEE